MHRFALGILLAVLVAISRPVATGGSHDLLAVGVVVWDGPGADRIALSVPTAEALAAYDALVAAPSAAADPDERKVLEKARLALLQGSGVHMAVPLTGPRVKSLVFYGVRSRAGRSAIHFDGTESIRIPEAAWDRARGAAWKASGLLADAPASVTASAARVLLGSRDDEAVRDALEALAAVRAEVASADALSIAEDPGRPVGNRVAAIRVLRSLGGKALAPEAFRRLADDRDPLVAAEAAR